MQDHLGVFEGVGAGDKRDAGVGDIAGDAEAVRVVVIEQDESAAQVDAGGDDHQLAALRHHARGVACVFPCGVAGALLQDELCGNAELRQNRRVDRGLGGAMAGRIAAADDDRAAGAMGKHRGDREELGLG